MTAQRPWISCAGLAVTAWVAGCGEPAKPVATGGKRHADPVERAAASDDKHEHENENENENENESENENENEGTPSPDDSRPPAEQEAAPDAVPHFTGREAVETTVSGEGTGPYRFTAWWHKSRIASWEKALAPYKGHKGLAYLEIGVFEGRSLLWMLTHAMTDPTSTATAVDIFMDEYEATFDANIAASGAADRITKIKEPSQTALRRLPLSSFDVIYIDGSHTADDVLVDAVLAWDLLREGGLIIFDDYNWIGRPHGGPLPPELLPKVAIDAFVTAHRSEIEIVDKGAQVMLRKLPNPCPVKDYCSPVGQYLYYWRESLLRDGDGKTVELTKDEIAVVEAIAKARRDGEVDVRIDRSTRESGPYKALIDKLDLDLSRRRSEPPGPTR